MIEWTATKLESELIRRITQRAIKSGLRCSVMDLMMEIEACHCNGCALDLAKLADAPDFDFMHDVAGIRRHINRETGKLGGCFLPRCALEQHTGMVLVD